MFWEFQFRSLGLRISCAGQPIDEPALRASKKLSIFTRCSYPPLNMTIAKLGLYVGGAAAAGTGLLFMMSTGGQGERLRFLPPFRRGSCGPTPASSRNFAGSMSRAPRHTTENKTIQRRMTRMIDPKERDIDLAMQQSQFYKNAKTKAQTPANLR